jgi:2-dehydro-3-deoxyphosphogluconate aldolase / (4S)-4-hydroxy-2-oxoglutarate aldolase
MRDVRTKIVEAMNKTGMVPVFYHPDEGLAQEVIEAAYRAGVRVFEFTNRGENAFTVFSKLLKATEKLPGLYLGIGTIMNDADTEKFIYAGARFIVSPILKPSMSVVCQRLNTLWTPGCATLTEIVNAKEAGADVIKIFPGAVLGANFVSSVLPVVPGLKLMPTGGVEPTRENLTAWFKAGVHCVGMGSQLLSKDRIADAEELERVIAETLALIKEIRQ